MANPRGHSLVPATVPPPPPAAPTTAAVPDKPPRSQAAFSSGEGSGGGEGGGGTWGGRVDERKQRTRLEAPVTEEAGGPGRPGPPTPTRNPKQAVTQAMQDRWHRSPSSSPAPPPPPPQLHPMPHRHPGLETPLSRDTDHPATAAGISLALPQAFALPQQRDYHASRTITLAQPPQLIALGHPCDLKAQIRQQAGVCVCLHMCVCVLVCVPACAHARAHVCAHACVCYITFTFFICQHVIKFPHPNPYRTRTHAHAGESATAQPPTRFFDTRIRASSHTPTTPTYTPITPPLSPSSGSFPRPQPARALFRDTSVTSEDPEQGDTSVISGHADTCVTWGHAHTSVTSGDHDEKTHEDASVPLEQGRASATWAQSDTSVTWRQGDTSVAWEQRGTSVAWEHGDSSVTSQSHQKRHVCSTHTLVCVGMCARVCV